MKTSTSCLRMTEMLEGSEIDEPMTLTQVVTRFTLRDMMERGESDEELDQVQLMTLHASKGWSSPTFIWWEWKRIAAAPKQH
ncbi:hypothetical protein [Klebsiella pneumoniae]|uniref:hypothetical protein n=1 Tax=Klebsiella pneumoniae TaxID=573 RepID=UPI002FDC79F3